MRWHIAQWFENKWWRIYLKGKSPKEYSHWKTNYWEEFILKIGLKKSELIKPMIDVGCGPAGIFTIFSNEQVTALDPLLHLYEDLSIFKISEYPKVEFVNQSFESFVSNKSYQTVFCLNAINHFIDLKASFQKLNEITAQKGQLIVSVDAHNHGFFRRLFALIPFDILHPHQYTLEEYESFVEKSGFEVENKVLIKKAFFFDYWVVIAQKRDEL